MKTGLSDLRIRVSDQKNGVYRIESVEWCSGERDEGVSLGHSDFVNDLVSCAFAIMGVTGNPSVWRATAVAAHGMAHNVMTVVAWIAT